MNRYNPARASWSTLIAVARAALERDDCYPELEQLRREALVSRHPGPWRTRGLQVFDGEGQLVGVMHSPTLADEVVDGINRKKDHQP